MHLMGTIRSLRIATNYMAWEYNQWRIGRESALGDFCNFSLKITIFIHILSSKHAKRDK